MITNMRIFCQGFFAFFVVRLARWASGTQRGNKANDRGGGSMTGELGKVKRAGPFLFDFQFRGGNFPKEEMIIFLKIVLVFSPLRPSISPWADQMVFPVSGATILMLRRKESRKRLNSKTLHKMIPCTSNNVPILAR